MPAGRGLILSLAVRHLVAGSRGGRAERILDRVNARGWFRLCLTLGRMLRATRYAEARFVADGSARHVHKRRLRRAPFLVWANGLLARVLDTGVRVLPQQDWEERERQMYRSLYGASVRIDPGGVLVLPCLTGETLASLLDAPSLTDAVRERAVALAAIALAEFHVRGFTHGDAMAENVMVDLEAGAASWFDFETVHDGDRPMDWRRADDLRALLATCLLRTPAGRQADMLRIILDAYGDEDIPRLVAVSFGPVPRRPLSFHLGQAPLSHQRYREIGRLLAERGGDRAIGKVRSGGARDLHHTDSIP